MKPLFVLGAGGHAKVVIDAIERQGVFRVTGVVTDGAIEGSEMFLGYPMHSEASLSFDVCQRIVVAIGDNHVRAGVAERLAERFPAVMFATVIHPDACIGRDVEIGVGSVIMAGTVINASTRIGRHCIVNTRASIDHDCEIGDYGSVAPGCTLGGGVSVGRHTAVCLGAQVIHGRRLGQNVVIGAGAVVVRSIPDNVVAYGAPAQIVRGRIAGERYL